MKPEARFFYIMGAVTFLLALYMAYDVPWHHIDALTRTSIILSVVMSASIGVTQFAVGWLVDIHIKESEKKESNKGEFNK